MNELKQVILYHLKHGQHNATSKSDLLRLCGLSSSKTDDRVLRLAIKELRHERHLIGLSLNKQCPGYYLINTVEELEKCMGTLKGYCVEAALTRRDLKVAGYALLHPGQLPLGI